MSDLNFISDKTDSEREMAEHLQALLALPAKALLEQLLGAQSEEENAEEPDPWIGYASPTALS